MANSARIKVLIYLVLALLASLSIMAGAISPQQECEQAGGTYTKEGDTQTCTISDPPGNNQGGVTKDTTEGQKGSSRSSHPEETSDCVSNEGGQHCPPGQQ